MAVDPKEGLERPDFVFSLDKPAKLLELLPKADAVILACPLTAETKGLFGEKQFAAMKPTAHFINIGRGPIVQTDALVKALEKKQIAGAGLDVTDPEPLPDAHPARAPAMRKRQILAAVRKGSEWTAMERYSSPILLRPVRVWNGRGAEYVPVAIFTDCTLPHQALALVELKKGVRDIPRDVVSSPGIQQQAASTLDRVAKVFLAQGFRSL